ncbi:hypothetical protein LTR66_015503, partial [Elasticomyces elasticus]
TATEPGVLPAATRRWRESERRRPEEDESQRPQRPAEGGPRLCASARRPHAGRGLDGRQRALGL